MAASAPVTQDGDHAATMATKGIHQIAVWSPDIRETLLCVTAIGTVLRWHGALTHDRCEPNYVFTTTCASVRHTTTSRRPGHALSATIGDLTAMLLRHRRRHYAAWRPVASVAHIWRPCDDPTATIGVSLYIWLYSMTR